ncbi:MAG: hypothetical protein ACSHUF_00455 [Candidatus Nasuia deltocephalinicola]
MLWQKKHFLFFKNWIGEKLLNFLKILKFIKIFLILLINIKNIYYIKKYKNILNINKILICFNCHDNTITYQNIFKNYYKSPKIINQKLKYIQYSLFLYKNFKRNSIYMNLVSHYLTYKEIFYLSNFLKWF